jgi:pimeloyl-ACP methyl ester carboxylesterase
MHYLYWNREGEKAPIVLHHGLASNARIWQFVAPRLAAAGHPVYAIDARGHGLSDKPDSGYDIETVVNDLAVYIESCRFEKPVIVGHSWGAAVALHYAARFAIGPRCPGGVCLVDGGFIQMNDGRRTWDEMRQRLTPPKLAGMHVDAFTAKLKEWNAYWNPPEDVIGIYMASFTVDENDRIAPRLTLERHLAILRGLWEYALYDDFARLRCPLLAIPAIPAEETPDERAMRLVREAGLEKLRQSAPHSVIQPMPDSIHDVPLQRPAELSEAILKWIEVG